MDDFSEKNALKAEKRIKAAVVTGPTATGKTRLAVELARRFQGEIVSVEYEQPEPERRPFFFKRK